MRQADRFDGMMAFELQGGIEAGRRFMNAMQRVPRAVSFAGSETLARHPASIARPTWTPERRAWHGIDEGLNRP